MTGQVARDVVHYGSGLYAAICGLSGARRETSDKAQVTCKQCLKIVRKSR